MTPERQAQVDRLLDECEAQGHPRHLEDPRALAGIAALLVESKGSAQQDRQPGGSVDLARS